MKRVFLSALTYLVFILPRAWSSSISAPATAYVGDTIGVAAYAPNDEDGIHLYCNGVEIASDDGWTYGEVQIWERGIVEFSAQNGGWSYAYTNVMGAVASFVATPSSGRAPLAVAFDGSSSTVQGSNVYMEWQFETAAGSGQGIGNAPAGITANYTYSNNGSVPITHNVSLHIVDAVSNDTTYRPVVVYPSGSSRIEVIDGTASAPYEMSGNAVTITAGAPPGQLVFLHWLLITGSGTFGLQGASSTSFTVGSADSVVQAVFGPAPPVNFSANPVTYASVQLNWSLSSSTAVVAYDILRTSPGISLLVIGTVGSTQSTFTDSSVVPGIEYQYRVRPRTATNHSSETVPAIVTIPAAPDADSDGVPDSLEVIFGISSQPNPSGSSNLNLNVHRPQ